MPGMMHHNCSRGCCLRGSRRIDHEEVRRQIEDELHGLPEVDLTLCPILNIRCPDDCAGDYC